MSGRMILRKSHRKRHHLGGRRRRMHGRGIMDFLGKANQFLRKNQVVSRVANTLANAGIAPEITGKVGSVASSLGYGRRRHHRMRHLGGALRLAGMGLAPAGGRRRHHKRRLY